MELKKVKKQTVKRPEMENLKKKEITITERLPLSYYTLCSQKSSTPSSVDNFVSA